jgi:cytochrome c biogenesis protein
LIVIIAGGLVSALFSQRIAIALLEGQTEKIPDKGFSIRLDKFSTEFYPDGSVKDWKSLVSVIENGQVLSQKMIEVNRPLAYGGLEFFQMSYGLDWDQVQVELEINFSGSSARTFSLKTGSYHRINESRQVRLLSFIPDFQLDSAGQATSRSAEARNPAALVEILEGGKPVFSGWVFYYHPEFGRFHRQISPGPEVRLKDFSAPPFSVLEASSDPGTNLVWAGSFLILLGLLASFYFPYKELRILIQPGRGPIITAFSRRNQVSFIRELEDLTEIKAGTKKISKEISDE